MPIVRRLVALLLFTCVGIVLSATPASAHTSFETSDPANGQSVVGPLSQLTITFAGDSEETGDGFVVLDATGTMRTPTLVSSEDSRTFLLTFDPPLPLGNTGVRWMVKAPDAHPIEGSYAISIIGDGAAATATTPETPVESSGDMAGMAGMTDQPEATDLDSMAAMSADEPGMADFLATSEKSTGQAQKVAAAGRFLGLGSALVGIGALVFATTVLRGSRGDIRYVMFWVRRSGLLLALGALVEFAAQVAIENGGAWSSLLSPSAVWSVTFSSMGIAVGLRIVGGSLLTTGSRLDTIYAEQALDPVMAIRELVGVGAHSAGSSRTQSGDRDQLPPAQLEPFHHDGDEAWDASSGSFWAVLGSAVLLASYLFDGHTVSKGDRLLTGVTNIIHVGAGAVWAGGLIMLVAVLWRRHRRGDESRSLQLAIRFSVVASVALVAVAIAGSVLAVVILDSPSELWTTAWGRLLIAKLVVVGVAAAGGAYNHKVVIPEMAEVGDAPALTAHFRTVVTIEATALVLATLLTAFLVGAAS